MENQTNKPKWTREEFMTYLLIYCMKADFYDQEEEIRFICNRVGVDTYRATKDEFMKDSDYERSVKLQAAFKALNYTEEDRSNILEEMNDLFNVDDRRDIVEDNTFLGISRLLKI